LTQQVILEGQTARALAAGPSGALVTLDLSRYGDTWSIEQEIK
jgi:hypothetical protein